MPYQMTDLASSARKVLEKAEDAGLTIDDGDGTGHGSIIDLLADNLEASISDLRTAIVIAGLAARFPRSTVER